MGRKRAELNELAKKDLWWKRNHNKAINFLNKQADQGELYDLVTILLDYEDEDDIMAFMASTSKHQALDILHGKGTEFFDSLLKL